MSGHTPGPWIVGFWGGQCFLKHAHGQGDCDYKPMFVPSTHAVSQAKEDGAYIVGSCDYGCELSEADARLIAAAPELLEALYAAQGAAEALEPSVLTKIRAVIAKAEGR